MTVDSFDPAAPQQALSDEAVSQCLDAAQRLDEEQFGLDDLAVKRLGAVMRLENSHWEKDAERLSDAQIEALVCFFTLAEWVLSGWEGGARSPVIPLVRVLKRNNAYPDGLTRWIKSHTDNRFLPHGSLMDRL